ncbi:hypothetical protein BDW62DRAFT_197416 [Aspergillus aurantiobrunneus]
MGDYSYYHQTPIPAPQHPIWTPMAGYYFHTSAPYPQSTPYCHCPQCTQATNIYESNNITDGNAQNILPSTARVMVGNLPRDVHPEMVRSAFNDIGHNFVHVFMGGKYPVAFVQFLKNEHAQQAIGKHKRIILNGRAIRVELSKDGQEELRYQGRLQEPKL